LLIAPLGELLRDELFPRREGDLTSLASSSSSRKLGILRIGEVIEVKELSVISLLLMSLLTGGGMKMGGEREGEGRKGQPLIVLINALGDAPATSHEFVP